MKTSTFYPGVRDYPDTKRYLRIVNEVIRDYKIPTYISKSLLGYVDFITQSELEKQLSAPMKWIGMYIALASLVCILAMVADLLHGFRSRKLWFPCRYFRINAAFLTVISVAMKLPLDLAGSMMGHVDRLAKLGSMAFMCTMMANLLPCLATMNNNELLSNITALCLLVVTLVVNVCIQIPTGVLSASFGYNHKHIRDGIYTRHDAYIYTTPMIGILASIYVICLAVLLILHVCSSLAILRSKRIIESKYQQGHDIASKDIQPSPGELLTIEKLHKHVSNHWIMAGSGSPQFITACFHTTSASGVICLLVIILHTYTMPRTIEAILDKDYDSDYDSSMIVIAIVQSIGLVIGTVAPLSRWFATLSFKVSSKIIANHFNVFKVERYWTQKLYDWKHARINLPFRSRNLEVVIETLKRLISNICIGLQNGVVVICKVIALIPFLSMICFLYCFRCMKWLLKKVFPLLGNTFEKLEGNNDLRPYVLQLEDEIELGERTLKGLLKSVKRMIKMGATCQPNNLIKLILGKSTSSFEGVKKFDHIDDHDVPCVNCWRLPVVNLTSIAVSLPKIQKEEVDSLLESVREGLEYVTVVEKCLNATDDHVSFQNAAETLWREIALHKKWLGNDLREPDFRENTAKQIVEWFRDKAKNIACSEARNNDNTGGENDDLIRRSIGANSMYRITETILRNCHTNIDATVSQNELFDSLSSMIADIIAACLTNLPQAIIMKCHTSVIEEREASVYDATQLLGETTQIIETLRGRDIPNMDPSDLPFIEKWRAFLGNP
ncbi:hypothetical protein HanRHA438_Chr10g0475931 [Helianthus annuus]|nr:hypothetical protein HanHA89_Chr10g0403081 [Helianthus annuus]KAJ0698468.1 hypothetical protein HanLR1_Chr10g0380301 [Helianthus annuus]KAJ0881594.1 hypothetical protein HanRHA438_Chr10g0475931 [Helianthus annuus]